MAAGGPAISPSPHSYLAPGFPFYQVYSTTVGKNIFFTCFPFSSLNRKASAMALFLLYYIFFTACCIEKPIIRLFLQLFDIRTALEF